MSKENQCKDKKCPFHGNLSLRGSTFVGRVVSDKMKKTITVEWERRCFIPKYERYERRWSKIKAHNPECINAKEGDIVKLKECRHLSKTKNFVVIEILGKDNEKGAPKVELYGKDEKIKIKKK